MTTPIDQLIDLQQQLIEAVSEFPVTKREEMLFDQWSLKDILAHFSGWNIHMINCLANLKNGKYSQWGGSTDTINTKSITDRQNQNWVQVYNEFITSTAAVFDQYSSLTPELFNQPLYQGRSYTALKSIQGDILHFQHHLDSVRKILKIKN